MTMNPAATRRPKRVLWAGALALLSAAMGIASAVIAAVMAPSINREYTHRYLTGNYIPHPTTPPSMEGGIYLSVAVITVVALLMGAVGVLHLVIGTRSRTTVTIAWVLFGIAVCTSCCSSAWLTGTNVTGNLLVYDNFIAEAFTESIPPWVEVSSVGLTLGMIVTFLLAAIIMSRRPKPPVGAGAPPTPPVGA